MFGLVQIQLPLLILSSYYLFFIQKNKSLIYFFMSFLIFATNYYLAVESAFFRIQYLPIGMILIVFLVIILNYFVKNALIFWLSMIFIVLVFSVNLAFLNDTFLFENRLISFLERMNIFITMLYDSYFFIIPQGLGGVNRIFDISSLGLGSRGTYPSHSGIGSMLYESSLYLLFIIYYLLFHKVEKVLKTSLSKISVDNENIKKYISTKPLNYHYRSLLFIILFWVIHNVFYLKGVVGPSYFSDDGIIIYMLLFLIMKEVYFIKKKC